MKLTLSYFDFDGGRGEPARLALAMAGIPFEDQRVPPGTWPDVKAQMPFHALPVLQVDDRELLTQSNTINRFVGRLADLYPSDPWQAALCDEVMDAVEDITHQIGVTLFIADAAQKQAARERLAAGPLTVFLERLEAKLKQRGNYFADGRLTMADLKAFMCMRWLRSGVLDHIPRDLTDRLAPALVAHFERVKAHPGVVAYYARPRAA